MPWGRAWAYPGSFALGVSLARNFYGARSWPRSLIGTATTDTQVQRATCRVGVLAPDVAHRSITAAIGFRGGTIASDAGLDAEVPGATAG